jgi:hypothetical protein
VSRISGRRLVQVTVLDAGQAALAHQLVKLVLHADTARCQRREMPVTSRMLTTPTSRPFSSTGRCLIQRAAISRAASTDGMSAGP